VRIGVSKKKRMTKKKMMKMKERKKMMMRKMKEKENIMMKKKKRGKGELTLLTLHIIILILPYSTIFIVFCFVLAKNNITSHFTVNLVYHFYHTSPPHISFRLHNSSKNLNR